jgi:hypothetical protein
MPGQAALAPVKRVASRQLPIPACGEKGAAFPQAQPWSAPSREICAKRAQIFTSPRKQGEVKAASAAT